MLKPKNGKGAAKAKPARRATARAEGAGPDAPAAARPVAAKRPAAAKPGGKPAAAASKPGAVAKRPPARVAAKSAGTAPKKRA